MIDPLIILDKDIKTFSKEFGLKNIKNESSDIYFLHKGLLKYSLNATKKDMTEIFGGENNSYVIVTGFGLTGEMHLGSKLLLNECTFFASRGLDTYIFLSKADAFSKQILSARFFKIKRKVLTKFEKLKVHKKLKIQNDKISNEIIKKISGDNLKSDLFESYNFYPDKTIITALLHMVGSVYLIHEKYYKNKKIIVLLGIDEIHHAFFISNRFRTLGIPIPIFLFNDLIIGYDGKKMGKTRPSSSLVISNSYLSEYRKLEFFLKKSHSANKCPAIEILRFSEYYLEPENVCSDVIHKDVKYIIKKECSN